MNFEPLKMKGFTGFILVTLLLLLNGKLFAQSAQNDTLRLTIDEAEKAFFDKNLSIVAKQYDIDMAKAAVVQAKLLSNPTVYYEQLIFNTVNQKYFDAGYAGENAFNIQKLIHIAGQRNKLIRFQKINQELSEYQFYDLLRTLKFQLHSSFYNIYFLKQSLNTYNYQLTTLESLVASLEKQFSKGNISFKEVMRIKASIFGLQSERLDFKNKINDEQNNLKVLLGIKSNVFVLPVIDTSKDDAVNLGSFNLGQLIDTAYQNRSDLKVVESSVRLSQADLRYQRSLAFPDLHLGYVYDKQGNFMRDYNALSLTMDLPIFNRNQGNIQLSKARVKQSETLKQQFTIQLENDVQTVYKKALSADSLYKIFDKDFTGDFAQIMQSMLENYRKRNISLIEFLDYYETYKSSTLQFNQLSNNRLNAYEELNYTVGKSIITF
jgi:cobalt-zinc-cadmium efflux system outer membrane protein